MTTPLAAYFPVEAIEWRVGQAGKKRDGELYVKCLAYITNRAIMDRLDDVVGPAHWRNEFNIVPTGVLCGISIRFPHTFEGEWVTKWDGSEPTDIESFKGGLSGAMKRAAVQWGIGRYLYDLPEGWGEVTQRGANYGKLKDGTPFRWDPPKLPKWALPQTGQVEAPVKETPHTRSRAAAELPDGAAGVNDDTPDPNDNGPLPPDADPAGAWDEITFPPADVTVGQLELLETYETLLKNKQQRDWFDRQRETVTDYDAAAKLISILEKKLGVPTA